NPTLRDGTKKMPSLVNLKSQNDLQASDGISAQKQGVVRSNGSSAGSSSSELPGPDQSTRPADHRFIGPILWRADHPSSTDGDRPRMQAPPLAANEFARQDRDGSDRAKKEGLRQGEPSITKFPPGRRVRSSAVPRLPFRVIMAAGRSSRPLSTEERFM